MRWSSGGVCALLLLLAGCAGPANGVEPERPSASSGVPATVPFTPGETVTAVLGGQNVRVDLPLDGDLVGVAVWFHGQGGLVDSKMNEDWLNGIRHEGWAVASGDLHGDAWGDPVSVADARALTAWAEAETGTTARLLIGGSMGAVPSLNAMIDGAVTADCWFGTEPVVDLTAVGLVPDADAQIAAVYGGPPPASSNPVARLDALPDSTRYFVVASPEDTWVPAAANADRLVAALQVAGADVEVRHASGEHGDMSHFRSEHLRDFAATCG